MFNLFRSQKQVVRYLLGAILLFVAFSMVITLVPGLFTAPVGGSQLVLAEVGGREITIPEVNLELRAYSQGETVAPADLQRFARQIIEDQIGRKVLLDQAEKLGLAPSEEEVAEWLKFQFPMLFPEGKFVGGPRYAAFIADRYKMSVPQFEEQFREEMMLSLRLRRLIEDSAMVYEEDLRAAFKRANEKAKIDYVQVSGDAFQDEVEVSEEEIAEYYENNKRRFRTPGKVRLKMLTLEGDWQPEMEIPEEEVRRYYSRNREEFRVSDRVRASHILFMTDGKDQEEIPEIKAKAEEVLGRIRNGADFAELAKEHSEDTVSAQKGGDLGWVTRGQMVVNFEDAAFALEEGETSDLVETEYGFHIIRVHERDEARYQPFEEVEDDIRDRLREERAHMARIERVDKAVNLASLHGAELEKVAGEVGGEVRTFPPFPLVNPPNEVRTHARLWNRLQLAEPGEVITASREGDTILAVITEQIPAEQRPLEEVREQIVTTLRQQKARELAYEQAQKIADAAREEGSSLEDAAAEFGPKVKSSEFFTRDGSIEGIGSVGSLGPDPFVREEGTLIGPVSAGNSQVVYRVAGYQEPDYSKLEEGEQAEKLLEDQLDQRRQEAFQLFRQAAIDRYQKEGLIVRYEDRIAEYLESIARVS